MSIRLHSHCQNDVEFPCHKCFLSGGLKAFLELCIVYGSTQQGRSKIALELLEFAHEKQISDSKEDQVDRCEKPDDWLSLNEGLQLFLFSMKLESQGYSDLKKKAVKAINQATGVEAVFSFPRLMESNPKCVTEFVCSCLEFEDVTRDEFH
ncbi:hypothetical protein Ocin01_19338 [Orchesella cincta]|uniref:Uncharacterized protein n=1 Tax=Orchesella cincta TaxID=48709 RepID=A0A1D2M331_ORCCI|nr:hypothetical protein Ocin01_19338 [Orchesella cincta]